MLGPTLNLGPWKIDNYGYLLGLETWDPGNIGKQTTLIILWSPKNLEILETQNFRSPENLEILENKLFGLPENLDILQNKPFWWPENLEILEHEPFWSLGKLEILGHKSYRPVDCRTITGCGGGRRLQRRRRRRPNNSTNLARALDHHAQGPNIPCGNPSLW